jgi:hypothetical protein
MVETNASADVAAVVSKPKSGAGVAVAVGVAVAAGDAAPFTVPGVFDAAGNGDAPGAEADAAPDEVARGVALGEAPASRDDGIEVAPLHPDAHARHASERPVIAKRNALDVDATALRRFIRVITCVRLRDGLNRLQ